MAAAAEARRAAAAAAHVVWRYHIVGHALAKSDAICVLCSNDPRVAEHGARLWLDGWAPLLIFSGGVGALTKGLYGGLSEAEYFRDVAVAKGVPESAILVEPRSTNTGENVAFTRELLAERGATMASFILVQKPFMERRSMATFLK